MTQRVLVTGAGGFVCGHIVDALLESGYSVIALDVAFDETQFTRWRGRPVEYVTTLPNTAVDYAIHGAAITAGPDERGETPEANFRANLHPAVMLSEWAAEHGVKRTIFISSSAVTRGTTTPLVTEDARYEPTGLYAVAKLAIEGLARTLRTSYGRDTLAVRLGYLYGPWEARRATRPRLSLVAQLIEEALMHGRVTVAASSTPTEWTYVRDIGWALVALLQAPQLNHALYHLSSGQAFDQMALARTVQFMLPGTEIHTVDTKAEFRGVLVGERLRADTGFREWTDLHDGLAETIAWFRQQEEQV